FAIGAGADGEPLFGPELRRLRRERGVSLAGLARLVHYSKGYLSKIENGEKPPTADVARRCDDALAADGALRRLLSSPAAGDRCPYPGLAAFGSRDAPWFFGREQVTAELLGRLAERLDGGGPLVVTAASGAGKSSLLRAGLVPALRSGALPAARGWPVTVFTPGARPLTELAARLAALTGRSAGPTAEELARDPDRCADALRAAGAPREAGGVGPGGPGAVLVVDQFEETFTVCESAAERSAFVRALCAAAELPGRAVVLGVRADFYGHCLAHPRLVPALSDGVFALRPLSVPELREAIVRPAEAAGLTVEEGLVELLLADLGARAGDGRGSVAHGAVAGEAAETRAGAGADGCPQGALPLLAHALLATWQQRSGRTLTVAGYRLTGGLHGAVAATAERVYARLDPAERRTARRVLLRLVQIGEDSGETRRRVERERLLENLPDPKAAAGVVDVFVGARLLTLDADTVEITHEALLRAWPRLREWIRSDRAGLLVHQRLSAAAVAWQRESEDPGALYRGARLGAARDWADDADRRAELSPLEERFLRASEEREAAEAAADGVPPPAGDHAGGAAGAGPHRRAAGGAPVADGRGPAAGRARPGAGGPVGPGGGRPAGGVDAAGRRGVPAAAGNGDPQRAAEHPGAVVRRPAGRAHRPGELGGLQR
ncbi:nSTAND1 domain-containing NTPase, partial [Streptomyces sp. URMC 123]|uniref:nSTAND1 domain-containing NTPase n=1 Tax=Streptomyces sp. URMC 123 TaxID=3423403 RepID=UPI003F1BB44B